MKTVRSIVSLVLFALCFFSAPEALAKAKKAKKFKATFTTEFFNSAIDPATSIFTTEVIGDGNAKFMGKTSFYAKHLFAFTKADLSEGVAWSGEMTLGAANGDLLYATYTGDIVPSSDADFPFWLLFDVTFDGGTGRFEDASGSATVVGVTTIEEDPTNGLFKGTSSFTFDGTLSK